MDGMTATNANLGISIRYVQSWWVKADPNPTWVDVIIGPRKPIGRKVSPSTARWERRHLRRMNVVDVFHVEQTPVVSCGGSERP